MYIVNFLYLLGNHSTYIIINNIKDIQICIFVFMQGGPHNHTIAALAVCLHHAQSPEFMAYQSQVLYLFFPSRLVYSFFIFGAP